MYQSVLFISSGDEDHDAQAMEKLYECMANDETDVHLMFIGAHHVTGYGSQTALHHIANDMHIRQELFPKLKALGEPYGIRGSQIHIEFGEPVPVVSQFVREQKTGLVVLAHNPELKNASLAKLVAALIPACHCDFHVLQ